MAPSVIPTDPAEFVYKEVQKSDVKITANGTEGHLNVFYSSPVHLDPAYQIVEQPIGARRPVRIACMGAGYSGLMMAIMFSETMKDKNAELVIYERKKDLGGTWLENRHPSCKCDIPAHNYAYSFAPNPDWPNYYATSQQIHEYMHQVADKYDCKKYIKYEHSIKSAIWNENNAKWAIRVQKGDGSIVEDNVDVFINAGGVLNNWKWPNIEGLHNFKGKLIHSARWDEDYDFTGKRLASIGIGSSGIQVVPQLAKVVNVMDVYIRTHTWISPAPGINEPTAKDPDMDPDYNFTKETLELFKDPEVLREYRVAIMDRRIENSKRAIADSDVQKCAQEMFRKSIIERLADSEKGRKAAEYLLPDFPVGCRRQTPGPGFLEAVTQKNIELRWDDVVRVTENGIVTRSGETKEYDVIVCATGFDTSFKPSFPLVGRKGVDLAQKWNTEQPKAYFGFSVPDMPNYFCFIGPNSPISNGSLILGIQATAVYIYKWLEKLQTEMRNIISTYSGTWNVLYGLVGAVVGINAGLRTALLLLSTEVLLFILWRLSRTRAGKTLSLIGCQRLGLTGMPTWVTDSHDEKGRERAWARRRHWTFKSTGVCLYILEFIIRLIDPRNQYIVADSCLRAQTSL